jgi:hypothetical protein
MASVHSAVFSDQEMYYLTHHPEVLSTKEELDLRPSGKLTFSIPVTDSIRAALTAAFGLRIEDAIPMRWIKGDTAPHTDVGASVFQNTYLVYLTDSAGEFIVDSQSYPIQSNTGFVFQEGLAHETQNTGHALRLMVGPMNEHVEPVGGPPPMIYYNSESDALAQINQIGFSYIYTVGDNGQFPYHSWRIAANSTGTSPQNVVYPDGSVLNSDGFYFLYPAAPCFLEGSTILCQVDGIEKYVAVENLQKGTLVKTSLHEFKPVVLLGKGTMLNPGDDARTENRLYKCSPLNYPELKEDLFITGNHSILEATLTDKEREDTIRLLGKLFVTEKKYRLMACVDERAETWNSAGQYTIWHFALENADEGRNYGVFANGLLVESCSIRFLKTKSNMALN